MTCTIEGRTLFDLSRFVHSKVADVPLGHLMLCESYSSQGPYLALRVEVEDDTSGKGHGILNFRTDTNWNGIGAVVLSNDGDTSCVDLGEPKFVVEANPIAEALAKRTYEGVPGMLSLSGSSLTIFAAYGPYANHRAWWDVASGKRVNVDGRVLLGAWRVGLVNIDGIFVPQLRYPEDFKSE